MNRTCVICVLVAVLALVTAQSWSAQIGMSLEELLGKYEHSLEQMNTPVRFRAETLREHSGDWNWDVAERTRKRTAVGWRRNGDVAYQTETQYDVKPEGGDMQRSLERTHTAITDHVLKLSTRQPDDPERRYDRVAIYESPKNYEQFVHHSVGEHGQVLDGRMPGEMGVSLPALIRDDTSEVEVVDTMEVVDGFPCVLVKADTRYGAHKVWLNTERGYLPQRIECERTTGDYQYSRVLGEAMPMHRQANINKKPYASLEKESIVVENIEIVELEGVFWPASADVVSVETYADGSVLKTRSEHRRSDYFLDPDFEKDGAFVPDIPNGTPVSFRDSDEKSPIDFEWYNGEAVPTVNIDHEEAIRMAVASLESKLTPEGVVPSQGGVVDSPAVSIRENETESSASATRSPLLAGVLFLVALVGIWGGVTLRAKRKLAR